jgi:short-subunit dehydrogenase
VRPLALDLAKPGAPAALAAHLLENASGLDLLVNNAGAGTWSPFETFPDAELERQWRVLLAAPIALCRAFFPVFAAQGRGAVVNVASLAGRFPIPFMSAYSAGKAGLSAFTRTLMLEAAGRGVVVLDFQPGDYNTGFNDNMRKPGPAAADTAAAATGTDAHGLSRTDTDAHGRRSDTAAPHADPANNAPSSASAAAASPSASPSAAAREARAWACCEAHLRAGPDAEHAARLLLRALRRGKSRTVVAGDFFQSVAGPLLARLAPDAVTQWFLRRYYRL